MTTQTTTLTDFLLARLAEDEAEARKAVNAARPGLHWRWDAPDGSEDSDASRWLRTVEEFPTTSGVGPLPAFPLGSETTVEPAPAMSHIARHDPARVLAEVEAKRAIVESCRADYEYAQSRNDDTTELAEEVMWALALPFADHPDFDESWRP